MDRMRSPLAARRGSLPSFVPRPMLCCASAMILPCTRSRGTKRSVMESSSDRAGMTLPKRYRNLSVVITAL